MSSTMSTVKTKMVIPQSGVSILGSIQEKSVSNRLVRSTSIEKIKRFNTYCSQQYYFLPAVIGLIKTTQLYSTSTERSILFVKSIMINTFIYKFILRTLQKPAAIDSHKFTTIISNVFRIFSKCFESTFLLACTFYLGGLMVFAQLLVCVYLLSMVVVPLGLGFLLACLGVTVRLYYTMNLYRVDNKSCKSKKKVL